MDLPEEVAVSIARPGPGVVSDGMLGYCNSGLLRCGQAGAPGLTRGTGLTRCTSALNSHALCLSSPSFRLQVSRGVPSGKGALTFIGHLPSANTVLGLSHHPLA